MAPGGDAEHGLGGADGVSEGGDDASGGVLRDLPLHRIDWNPVKERKNETRQLGGRKKREEEEVRTRCSIGGREGREWRGSR